MTESTAPAEHTEPAESADPAPAVAPKNDRLVWIDLEMTGLDPARHTIVEVAALVTDAQLNILDPGVDLVVHASEEQLEQMDDFVRNMHETNGLLAEIRASQTTLAQAEEAVLELVDKYCDPEHPAPLAGNSIATDRSFIRAEMPRLDAALHYRMIDVSSIKELTRRWYPRVYYHQPDKGMAHRALADIVESIRELDYYRRAAFVAQPGPTSEEATAAQEEATAAYQQFL
ncbi:oligoribonuclease [Corynebacterium uberis]|uniref:oligoribonuclease n=1 Tax=Corynebacterium TaxID=1716 RepID=UPI001D0AEEBD|nr:MULTISPECIES: oligoribonuclease [Corynebacterium]MCZ9310244.1 oligoribonuclease [Corynebacterium sp. c6VSa_13]UDL73717.1 oligoribonuclease [Corynebacterium uberis]UDL75400.1 oligoribonuclease [Corynebacterium uberis]UDL77613.1 oligoribonuclease [Corynebacterium uberis]UDL79898.1 oligoribonuclease [Corynebacterium uberis]